MNIYTDRYINIYIFRCLGTSMDNKGVKAGNLLHTFKP